eukprot:435338-Rhodomonas_salina.1
MTQSGVASRKETLKELKDIKEGKQPSGQKQKLGAEDANAAKEEGEQAGGGGGAEQEQEQEQEKTFDEKR